MYIVFDTNIWLSELALNSSAGAAARFYIHQNNAVVAIPEVVRLEVEHNLNRQIHDFIRDIEKNYRKLLAIFGSLKEIRLPDENDIEEKVQELISSLDVKFEEIPFSINSAKSSLQSVVTGTPPSGPKNQQFKDGVIWADCLNLLSKDDVYLVTNDKGFYEGGVLKNGLASELQLETKKHTNKVSIYASLSAMLENISAKVNINKENVLPPIVETIKSEINILRNNDFKLGERISEHLEFFATEKSHVVYVEFNIVFTCSDTSDADRSNPKLEVIGNGEFDTVKQQFNKLSLGDQTLTFRDINGEQSKKVIALSAASLVIGHRTETHKIKHGLNYET